MVGEPISPTPNNPGPAPATTTFTPHLVVGFGLIFLGVVLALDRLGFVEAERSLQYWPVGLILLGAAMVAQSFRPAPAGTEVRGQFPLGPAVLLLVFVLAVAKPFSFDRETEAGPGHQQIVAIMSGDRISSAGEEFRGARMTAVMGGAELDLRNAVVAEGDEVVINVFALMGGTVVRVPPDWTVDLKVTRIMGGVKDERRRRPAIDAASTPTPDQTLPAPRRIVLRGMVMMGGVVIKS